MKTSHIAAVAAVACLMVALASPSWSAEAAPKPWQQLYAGDDATGPNVIGLWQFLPGQETKDSSGHNHDLTLRGQSASVKTGPLGAALESFRAGTDNDTAQGAIAKDADDLTPAGAFTLEAWFAAKPELDQCANVFLLDKKYINYVRDNPDANWDYCLYLQRSGPNKRRMMASLGFGKDSAFITGPEIDTTPGQWRHVAFTYDGAGRCRFFLDGQLLAKVLLEGRGAVANGRYDFTIGDRFGSTHTGFPGYIAQVRVCNGIVPYLSGGLNITMGRGRTAFLRMEKNAALSVVLGNETPSKLSGGRAQVLFGKNREEVVLPDLAPNEEYTIPLKVDTTARPGDYQLKVVASATSGTQKLTVQQELPVTIVPRELPNQMPVVMWGGGDLPRLKAIGFTHQLISLLDDGKVWEAGRPGDSMSSDQIEQQGKMLDGLLRAGLHGAVYLHPGTWVTGDAERKAKYNRVDRNGVVRAHDNVCGNFPEVKEFCYNAAASIAQTFGKYPALDMALVHSEVRDGSELCFHDHDQAAFRQAAGYDIPVEALSKGGINYGRLKDFPANRVLKDDDHLLTFYRWFWKNGDGWNVLHSEINRGLKSTGRKDLRTFFDPAVRVPDVWGSGGEVDVVSQWTYSYADPIKIGQATDELFAMAEGRPGQQVMKMTQVIWYRSQTAPKPSEDESKRVQWEKDQPTAAFITIAPDHMREAFWSKMSRPIRGIMYHGWQSLVDTGATEGYVFTNAATQGVLTELTRDVVRPLGPTLLQVPDRKADVAILQSFSSQVFAGRGTYGWSEAWEAQMHEIVQWAHLQPRIVFDETIMRDGLPNTRVLVMPFCDVLTEGVVKRIRDFQKLGGLVVADEYLCPAIIPDIVIPSYKRSGKPDEDKAALQARSTLLRKQLDDFYTRYGDASNADIVLRFRQYGDTDYLFALNDKRTFGDYVGHHGKVMEKGLPNSAAVSVQRKSGFLYDLVDHKPVAAKASGGSLKFEASFGPGGGHLYMITSQKIARVGLKAPGRAKRGTAVDVTVSVLDSAGAPLKAVVPVQIDIRDAQGKPAEFSGYYGAKDGKVSLRLSLAANEAPGTWTITAKELASGLSKQQKLVVVQ